MFENPNVTMGSLKLCLYVTSISSLLVSSSISAKGESRINSKQCGISEPVGKIINGSVISKPQVPWLVTVIVYKKDGWEEICGGSIITRNIILTAAHCIPDPDTFELHVARIHVHYNTTRLLRGPFIQVKYGVFHKQHHFNGRWQYDIGLIKLEKPLPKYDRFVRPVCLPKQGQKTRPGPMLFAGTGRIGYKKPPSQVILSYTARVLTDEDCRTAMAKEWREIHPKNIRVICASNPWSMAYDGDSGGPLTAYMKNGRSAQFGIASYVRKNSNYGLAPAVFTRVAHYTKWIKRSLKKIKRWRKISP
nr:mast cell protease 4-like [Dermacentor andersoni]